MHTAHCVLHTAHCTLCMAHCTLHSVYCTVDQETVHAARISRGSQVIPVRLMVDEAPCGERGVLWVSMSGLLCITLPAADSAPPVPLSPLALAYIRALYVVLTTDDLGLQLEAGLAHDCRLSPGLPWSVRVFLTYLSVCTGAGCTEPGVRLPPWANRTAGEWTVVWSPGGVASPVERSIVPIPAQRAGVLDSVFQIRKLWTLQWTDPVGCESFAALRQQLHCL